MGSNPYPPETPKKGGKTWIILLVLGCVALPVIVAVLGIIAAIVIPNFLGARVSANESQNIGDTRAVISAEMAYSASSGGRFGTLECLEAPASCISGYSGASFISAEMAKAQKAGYRRTFALSADGEGFTYVAVPLQSGSGTRARAFCGDGTGIICETRGAVPSTSGGRCEVDATCTPLK